MERERKKLLYILNFKKVKKTNFHTTIFVTNLAGLLLPLPAQSARKVLSVARQEIPIRAAAGKDQRE